MLKLRVLLAVALGGTSGDKTCSGDELKEVAGFEANRQLFDAKEVELAQTLVCAGQQHLFAEWAAPGESDADKHKFFAQVSGLDAAYPGGIAMYLSNAKKLLAESKSGANPMEGFVPSAPMEELGKFVDFTSDEFENYEKIGRAEVGKLGVVLVAGGLGERLGYSGIKVELPSETASQRSFIQLYCESILAFQALARSDGAADATIPLAIMTSDDTDQLTRELMNRNSNFGLAEDQVTYLKQEKVAALSSNEAHISTKSAYKIATKPHGHGDVHMLMHSSGTAKAWAGAGKKWLYFFQDTNGLAFNSLLAAIGVSVSLDLSVNSVCVPRKAGDVVGGIMTLAKAGQAPLTVNVEYNQIDALLKDAGKGGDVNDPKTGFSPYPGSINQLILNLDDYVQVLERTRGMMPEFVNPKYTDDTKTKFKKPTRLETMMQDYPRELSAAQKSGFTAFTGMRVFSPVKNSVEGALGKVTTGLPAHSAATGEDDMYGAAAERLAKLGVRVGEAEAKDWGGIRVVGWPKLSLAPAVAADSASLASAFPHPAAVSISSSSTLVVRCPASASITVEGLQLDGHLELSVGERVKLTVRDLTVKNAGSHFQPLGAGEHAEVDMLRGYRLTHAEQGEEGAYVIDLQSPGEYVVGDHGVRQVA